MAASDITKSSVTLRFVTAGDPISRVIRGGEMGFWASHTEALMPDGALLGAHADGGVQARAGNYDTTWTEQLFVNVPCTDDQQAAFEQFLTAQIGKPYDMEAIGEMAVGALTGQQQSWPLTASSYICSALQTSALITAGILTQAPATPRLTTPRDLLMMVAVLAKLGTPQTRKLPANAASVTYSISPIAQ